MKNKLLIILTIAISTTGFSQEEIPEGGFENWTPSSLNLYYEPSGNWWTTLNALTSLGAPVTVTRTTDVHSGTYAAKLVTKQWGTFLLPGLLVSGRFVTASPFVLQGQPFSSKPIKFKGWFKYTSVNGDSGAVVAILHKYNTNTGKRDTVALAVQVIKNTVSAYTPFDIYFDYWLPGVFPDSITVVLTSSAAGANFQGQVNSTLIVDDVMLDYATGLSEMLFPEFEVTTIPNPSTDFIDIFLPEISFIKCKIYSIEGQLITEFTPKAKQCTVGTSNWNNGTYLLQVFKSNSLISTKRFTVIH